MRLVLAVGCAENIGEVQRRAVVEPVSFLAMSVGNAIKPHRLAMSSERLSLEGFEHDKAITRWQSLTASAPIVPWDEYWPAR